MRVNRRHFPLQTELLKATFCREEYVQASGQPANNKFIVERLRGSRLQAPVIGALGAMATHYSADLLLAVPSGGDWLAEETSYGTGIPYATLWKDEDKSFIVPPDAAEDIAASTRIVVVDDILNMLTNTRKTLALPGVAERAVAAIAVIDRGPVDRPRLDIPAEAILRMPVEPQLPANHELWQYADTASRRADF